MTNSEPKSGPAIAFEWWKNLTEDTRKHRAALARMRRAATPLEVMYEPQALRLIERLPRHPDRVAALAGVLAFVRHNQSKHVASAIGRRSLDGDDRWRPKMSETRFRRLLQTRDDGLMEAMRRVARLTKGTANVHCLSEAVLFWGDRV